MMTWMAIENICVIARIIKNPANKNLTDNAEILNDKNKLIIATKEAGKLIFHHTEKSINFCLAYIMIETIATGKKTIRFIACAKRCGRHNSRVNMGTKIVPPPIPMPATTPAINPLKINKNTCKIIPKPPILFLTFAFFAAISH